MPWLSPCTEQLLDVGKVVGEMCKRYKGWLIRNELCISWAYGIAEFLGSEETTLPAR